MTAKAAAATVTSNPTSRAPPRRRDLIAVPRKAGCSTSREGCLVAGPIPAPTGRERGPGGASAALAGAVRGRQAALGRRVGNLSGRGGRRADAGASLGGAVFGRNSPA